MGGGLSPRVCVVNLGCKVNRVESDWIESALADAGARLVAQEDADVVIVNTCAVTGEAQTKTRKAVRHAASLPQGPLVVATGCVANLFPAELESLGERVRVVADKRSVAEAALGLWAREGDALQTREGSSDVLQGQDPASDDTTLGHGLAALGGGEAPASSPRHLSFRVRRGVKVQDGCDNRCTYCIVWRARGASRSMELPWIEEQVRRALEEGAAEIVLSGINLGRFEACDELDRAFGLEGLLDRVCALGAPMVRLSSIEPPDMNAAIAHAMARNADHVCAHLHLPLQSGCDATLARMGRTYRTSDFARIVDEVRSVLPRVSLSTDVIVGFPGETEDEFAETLAFCRSVGFSKMHVFRYSVRPDTVAASMPGQVPPAIMRERSERLRALADELRAQDAARRVGDTENVLVEYVHPDGSATGTTASYHDVVLPAGAHSLDTPGVACVEIVGTEGRLLQGREIGEGRV